VFLADQTLRSVSSAGEASIQDRRAGEVVCRDAGVLGFEGDGKGNSSFVDFEFKGRERFNAVTPGGRIDVPIAPGIPDAITADPAHYSVLYENDEVRVLRIKMGPGEASVMHAHPAYCWIQLTDGFFKMTAENGAVAEPGAPTPATTVDC